jgi:purine-cytosine permease-like protein
MKLRISSVIVLLLLLIGETFDVLAELVLNQFMLLIAETMEFFVVLGFFVMSYYIYQKKEKLSKKRRKKR